MDKRKSFLAIMLIGFGLLLFFGQGINFLTIAALLFLVYGVHKIRQGEEIKTGYILLAVGSGLILLEHLMLVVAIILISLGLFYAKVKKMLPRGDHIQKQNFIAGVHWDRDPWVLRSISMWHVLGEHDIDLSLASVEEPENIMMLQGVVGDIDLVISEDYGVEIEAFVMFGQIEFGPDKETGMVNRLNWRSPNYDLREKKVKIMISYLVGDIDIRLS
ncbi:cell wall-active antibiotics response protein LiaF [Paenibacillus sp. YPG26]|uniref:cell wall-active antibiotics response protein LiaF n=1 Tax=Paenibacillus sp. YPG26 TaxID=2878915 RepID=UPI00203EFD02|nr:cell wall-active antibiotics response protein LiaF [Paenibacillus sp. YPG26]USB32587.1 cell wall-active antibiotics response protein LiaF [Paenibacillus sp. YPG26]